MEELKPTSTELAPEANNSSWIGAFKAYAPSRDAIKVSLSANVWLFVVTVIVNLVINLIFKRVFVLNELLALLFASLFAGSRIYTTLAGVRGKRVEFGDAFGAGLTFMLKLFGLNVLVGLTLLGSLLLLVVPFFFITPRLSLASYFLVDQKMGILDSYKASWRATKGHSLKVWAIIGVTLLMCLPVITVIGLVATIYLIFMYQAATTLLYQYLINQNPTLIIEAAVPAAT
jgi:hypothetical protein